MNTKQKKLFDQVAEMIRTYLEKDHSGIIRKKLLPAQLRHKIDLSICEKGVTEEELMDSIKQVFKYSVHTNSPLFLNQMWGSVQLPALIGDFLTTLLNTSMYTYEVAPLMTLIEKECIKMLCSYVWSNNDTGDGIFTPGGSISNIEAMVLARNTKFPKSRSAGISQANSFSIFISDQAHYSFKKGASFLGFGLESIVEIATNNKGKVDVSALRTAVEREKHKGRIPMMLVGVAGTTMTGNYDDLMSLAAVAKEHDMWFHVDAVYGGSLLFSQKNYGKLKGICEADSVSWNLHKIMDIPLVCATLLTKRKGILHNSFAMDADYLFHDDFEDYDLGQKSLQCGRRVDAIKLWLAWKYEGTDGFENRVNLLVERTQQFADKIKQRQGFELYCEPESTIVCFEYVPYPMNTSTKAELNKHIRTKLFEEGKILLNYAVANGKIVLRCVITNTEFSEKDMNFILKEIERIGKTITKNQLPETEKIFNI